MFQSITSQINSSSPFLLYLGIVLGVTSIASVQSWRWWKEKEAYKSLKSLPSPPQYWVLGNLPQILAAVKQKKLFQQFFDWSQQLGPMYVIWNGRTPVVIF
jgi:unspecific monooxygenase